MKPLFAQPENQKFFEENGYLVIDALDENDVQVLRDYYSHLDNSHKGDYGFHVSMDNPNKEFVTGVINKLKEVIFPKVSPYFQPCKMFTASYVVKEPTPNSFVPPHQDWSFTDDKEYNSVTVWTALQDTDIDNGAMAVLPGSHKWFTGPRASPSPGFITPFQAYGMDLFAYMKLIPMKAGQSLIFENKTLHASPPNNSNSARIAIGIGISQLEAPLLHYYVVPNSNPQELQSYSIDPEFFFKYNNSRLYQMQQIGEFPEGYEEYERVINNPKILSKGELEQLAIDSGLTKDPRLDVYLQRFYEIEAQRQAQNVQNNQSAQNNQSEQNDSNNNTSISLSQRIKQFVSRLMRA